MDIDSINAGTVDTKGWLNPVVGTLRAAKIYCDDIEGAGGASDTVSAQKFQTVSPNADNLFLPMGGAVSCRSTDNFHVPALSSTTFTQVSATNADKNFIFPTNLVVGSMYEYYMAGEFSNPTGTNGALSFYPAFNQDTPFGAGTYMNEFIIPFPAVGLPVVAQTFELKITFRVTAFTDTTVTCESVYTGTAQGPETAVIRVERGYNPQPSNTPARSSYVIPFIVWAKGANYAFTRTISYLRQIC